MINLNYTNNEIVSSPTIIISGSCDTSQGYVQVVNNDNSVFPPSFCEINNHQFKILVNVNDGPNNLDFTINQGSLNNWGFPINGKLIESTKLIIQFYPLNNKPIHLCVIVGKDSQGNYDMPNYKLNRGETSNLDIAIQKLKVAGRMMQAYTQDEMRQSRFSNRSFQFVEETTKYQGVFGYDVQSKLGHKEIKVHVLRSPKTIAEIRNPNYAQQNFKGSDTGWLFSHGLDLIRNSDLYKKTANTPIQCAVIYLDAHYDVSRDLILSHAALGGGDGTVKLAIFGSHGLHSWPLNFANITPSFVDSTPLSKKEVANDAGQCDTSWECLNVTMGAFMHEIGHSLSCPHQVDGVMLRDYLWWNRSFMTREVQCMRTHSNGAIIGLNGWDKVCHWNILDKIRFLYHESFALPIDDNNVHIVPNKAQAPVMYNIGEGRVQITSEMGIFLIEVITKDLARCHKPYLATKHGGQGLVNHIELDYKELYAQLKNSTKEVDENFNVRVLSLGGDLFIDGFKKQTIGNTFKGNSGLGKRDLTAFKSTLLGRGQGPESTIQFKLESIFKLRIYHGGALDGIRVYFRENSERQVLLGNEKPHYTDISVSGTNPIKKFHFRNGLWVDAIQIEFANGQKTAMLGNATGGHLSTLQAPQGHEIIGMYGYATRWIDGIGILYA